MELVIAGVESEDIYLTGIVAGSAGGPSLAAIETTEITLVVLEGSISFALIFI